MTFRHRRRLATRPGVIVVDGVYTNGAVARLAEVAEVAEASGSVLVVDETHSFGVTPGGLGVCEEAGVVDRVHFRAIGLSKACASRGGEFPSSSNRAANPPNQPPSQPSPIPLSPPPTLTRGSPGVVVGPSRALEALRFVDRGLIFSTPPLEHEIIGYNATLDVLLRDEWRREKLHATHAVLQRGLLALGYDDDIARSERQILSIVTGDAARTAELRDFCVARGVFGSVFLPPFALDGRSFVRFTVHCGMNDAQCDRFLEVMEAARYIMK
jgi:CAI-1 autoinducer synthase